MNSASVGIAPVKPGGNSWEVSSAGISINILAPISENDNCCKFISIVNSPNGVPSSGIVAFCIGTVISKIRSKLVNALSGQPSLLLSADISDLILIGDINSIEFFS